MKKIIKAIGIIAVLGSVAIASTTTFSAGVSKSKGEDTTTVNRCDPLEHLMGWCRSSETPLSEY